MTITAKLVDVGGVEFAVSQETDTVDVNGFSDTIAVVSATSAKFSGGANMTPNSGLRIGIKNTVIESSLSDLRTRSVIATTTVSDPDNAINNNLFDTTGSSPDGIPAIAITVDFGSSATSEISAKIFVSGAKTVLLQVSTNNSTWVTVATTTNIGTVTLSGGIQTYRYARVNVSINTSGSIVINEVFEASFTGNTTVNIRASDTIDTANGTILDSKVITIGTTITLDSELFLINSGKFYTLQIVSFSAGALPVKLTTITSIKEV